MKSGFGVRVVAGTARFDVEDQRWLEQAALLYAALRDETGAEFRRGAPEPGTKGAVDTVALALGSSGAVTAAVACFRAWLARDKTRNVTVSWTDDNGENRTLTVYGDNVDRASFQALAEAAGKRLESRE